MNLKQLEFYTNTIWPVHRRFVSGLSQRCKNCVLNAKASPIGADGVCEACQAFSQEDHKTNAPQTNLEPEFDKTIRSLIGQGRYADATLLLSGGKDSAYILDRLRKEYPDLRLFCAIIDNGFMAPAAMKNAAYVSAMLDVDYLVVRSFKKKFNEELRNAFLNLNGRGCYEVVDFTDGNLIFDSGMELASQIGTPVLIGGLSWVQLEKIFKIKNGFETPCAHGVHVIHPLSVWKTDEQDVRKHVRDRGLIPPGQDSPLVTNSDLILPECVVDILNLGYSSFEPEFAQLVREKKTDRNVWIKTFEMLEYGVKTGRLIEDANKTLKRLRLSLQPDGQITFLE